MNGRTFQYEVSLDPLTDEYHTEFYSGTRTVRRRAGLFGLFGPAVEREEPVLAFVLDFDVEDPQHTKDEVRAALERGVATMGRADEIARGELI